MAARIQDVDFKSVSVWTTMSTPSGVNKEHHGTFSDDLDGLNDDIFDLLKFNTTRAFKAKEKLMVGQNAKQSSAPISSRSYNARSRRPHAFILDIDNDEMSQVYEKLLQERNFKDNSEKIVDSYAEESEEPSTAFFVSTIEIDSWNEKFVCVFITGIDNEKFTFESQQEIADRIERSFNQDIPNRLVYPFYIETDDEEKTDSVKFWEKGSTLTNYLLDSLGLEHPQEVYETIIEGGLEGESKSSSDLISEARDMEEVDMENVSETEFSLRIAGRKVNFTLEDVQEGNVKLWKEDDRIHAVVKGLVEIPEDDDSIEKIEDLMSSENEIKDYIG